MAIGARVLRVAPSAVLTALVIILCMAPIFVVVFTSFWSGNPLSPGGVFTLETFKRALETPWYWETIGNTFYLGFIGVLFACLFGIPLAWITRTNTPFLTTMKITILIPFFIPGFIGAAAWSSMLASTSPIYQFLSAVFHFEPNIYSLPGMAWVLGVYYTPYVYLFVSGALGSMDPSLEEASRISGASLIKTTVNVTLPLVTPAIASAVLLVFIMSLDAFTVPLVLGWPANFYTLSTGIYRLMQNPPVDYNLASSLSLLLFVFTFAGMYLYKKIVAKKVFTTVTGKGFRPQITDLGKWKYVTFAFCILYISLAAVLPFISILLNSLSTVEWNFKQGSFPTLYYYGLMFDLPNFFLAVENTLVLSVGGSILCLGLCLLVSWVIHRTQLRGRGLLDYTSLFPLSIPSMVMSVGVFWIYIRVPWIYSSLLIMLIALFSRYIAYAVRSTSSTLMQIHKELEESSRMSGASWGTTFTKITIPLLRPGIMSGWVMLLTQFFIETSLVILLWTSPTILLSILLIEVWRDRGFQLLYAMGVTVVVTLGLVLIIFSKLLGVSLSGRQLSNA